MTRKSLLFADYYGVTERSFAEHGAFNISLECDTPAFIDPFLLFGKPEKEEYREIHENMIRYICYLQKKILEDGNPFWKMMELLSFPEIKQTYLGYTMCSNAGRGNAGTFAENMYYGLKLPAMRNFSGHEGAESAHIEKLCLLKPGTGKDKLSDFVTRFALEYLIDFTQSYAKANIDASLCAYFTIPRARFDWVTESWKNMEDCYLPTYRGDCVILTPKDILTKDDTFINRDDMLRNMEHIPPALPNDALRDKFNEYFSVFLKNADGIRGEERKRMLDDFINKNPELIDFYLIFKEGQKEKAIGSSTEKVNRLDSWLNAKTSELMRILESDTTFYKPLGAGSERPSGGETRARLMELKSAIEDHGGYVTLYDDANPISNDFLQRMMKTVWGAVIRPGERMTSVRIPDFVRATSNNIGQIVSQYVQTADGQHGRIRRITVIFCFTDRDYEKVRASIRFCGLSDCEDIVLIDARKEETPTE